MRDGIAKIACGQRRAPASAAPRSRQPRTQFVLLHCTCLGLCPPVGLHPSAAQLCALQQLQLGVAPEERQVLAGRARLEVAVPVQVRSEINVTIATESSGSHDASG